MNKKLALILACCVAGSLAACNESVEWKSPDGCTDGVKICKDNAVQVCQDGEFVVEQKCEGSTPKCDVNTKTCVAGGKKDCEAGEKKCDGSKLMACVDGNWELSKDCSVDGGSCNAVTLVCTSSVAVDCTVGDVTITNGNALCINGSLVTCTDGTATTDNCAADEKCLDDDTKCTPKASCTYTVGEDENATEVTVKHGETVCKDYGVFGCNDGNLEEKDACHPVKTGEDDNADITVCMDVAGNLKCEVFDEENDCKVGDQLYKSDTVICDADGLKVQTCKEGIFEDTETCPSTEDPDRICKIVDDEENEGQKIAQCFEKVLCKISDADGNVVAKYEVGATLCNEDETKILVCGEDGELAEATENQCEEGQTCKMNGDNAVCKTPSNFKYETVKDIRDDFASITDGQACSGEDFVHDAEVTLTGMVTGIVREDKGFYIQDATGGVLVFCPEGDCINGDVEVNATVTVTATAVAVRNCQLQVVAKEGADNGLWAEAATETVDVTAEVLTDLTEMASNKDQIDLDGKFVTINTLTAISADGDANAVNAWIVKSGDTEISVGNLLMKIDDALAENKDYNITGVVDSSNGKHYLYPRSSEDIFEIKICAEGDSGAKCAIVGDHEVFVYCNGAEEMTSSREICASAQYCNTDTSVDSEGCVDKCTANHCEDEWGDEKNLYVCDTATGKYTKTVCTTDLQNATAACSPTLLDCEVKCAPYFKMEEGACVEDVGFCEADKCENGQLTKCGDDSHYETTSSTCPGYDVANADLSAACVYYDTKCNPDVVCQEHYHLNGGECKADCTVDNWVCENGKIRKCNETTKELNTDAEDCFASGEGVSATQVCAEGNKACGEIKCNDGYQANAAGTGCEKKGGYCDEPSCTDGMFRDCVKHELAASVVCYSGEGVSATQVCATGNKACGEIKCDAGYMASGDGKSCVTDPTYCTEDACEGGKIKKCTSNHFEAAADCYPSEPHAATGLCADGAKACSALACATGWHLNDAKDACLEDCKASDNKCEEGIKYTCDTTSGKVTTITCNEGVTGAVAACNAGKTDCELKCNETTHYLEGGVCKEYVSCDKSTCSADKKTLTICDSKNHVSGTETCTVSAAHAGNAAWTSSCVATDTTASCEDVCATGYALNDSGECVDAASLTQCTGIDGKKYNDTETGCEDANTMATCNKGVWTSKSTCGEGCNKDTNECNPITSCTDKDGNTITNGSDYCTTDGKATCDNGNPKNAEPCPYGCESGACKPAAGCTDKDGNAVEHNADYCTADGKAAKCDNGSPKDATECEFGCTAGACNAAAGCKDKDDNDVAHNAAYCTAADKVATCYNGTAKDETPCEYGCDGGKCNPAPATCDPDCSTLTADPNGSYTCDTASGTPTCILHCNDGYEVKGGVCTKTCDSSLSIRCESGSAIKCVDGFETASVCDKKCLDATGCVECINSDDCTVEPNLFCDEKDHVCGKEKCADDTDSCVEISGVLTYVSCSAKGADKVETPCTTEGHTHCDETAGCVECTSNTHCSSRTDANTCTDNVCVCDSDSDKKACSSALPYCHATKGCVECLDNSHCTDSTKPVCSEDGECVAADPEIKACNFQSIYIPNTAAYGRVELNGKADTDYTAEFVCSNGTDTIHIAANPGTDTCMGCPDGVREFVADLHDIDKAGDFNCIFTFKLTAGTQGAYACAATDLDMTVAPIKAETSEELAAALGNASYTRAVKATWTDVFTEAKRTENATGVPAPWSYVGVFDYVSVVKAGDLNFGTWVHTNSTYNFDEQYIKYTASSDVVTALSGKTRIAVSFGYTTNNGNAKIDKLGLQFYNAETALGDSGLFDIVAGSSKTLDHYSASLPSTIEGELSLRIIAYQTGKDKQGNLRINPITISALSLSAE